MSTLFSDDFLDRPSRELAPGAHLVPGWLTLAQQSWIVGQYRQWVAGPVPLRAARVRGHEMSVRTVCLGWHWQPYKYTRRATDVNGNQVLDFPDWMVRLGRQTLVNYYDDNAHMGMHQDKDERSLAARIPWDHEGLPGHRTRRQGLERGRINITMRVTGMS